MAYKINFKDSNCKYVEDYNAGKYGTKIRIYFCEGDGCCPKQYSGSVGAEIITADTIDELKLKLDRAVASRDKEIAKTLTDSKKIKTKDADYTKQELLDAVMEAYGFNKKEANEWIKKASEGSKKAIVEGFKGNAKKSFYNDSKKKVKDSYGEWDYEINCEGNQWSDGGFDSEEEAEDEAIAKVNDLLARHFPEDYAIDDFDITIMNNETGETYMYDPYTDIRDSKKKAKDCGMMDNMAFLTPGPVKLKRASKKFNQKDAKFKDASADEIINLFHEAYTKGRTWDWLKNKLPSTFLNLENRKHWKKLFPIQADRQGKLEGVYLKKPKQKSEELGEKVDTFLNNLNAYKTTVEDIATKYNLDVDSYRDEVILDAIKKAKDKTDSRREFTELDEAKDVIKKSWDDLYYSAHPLDEISIWGQVDDYIAKLSNGRENFRKEILKNEDEGFYGQRYVKNQKEPIIYNNYGEYIRSDSKVGPLTPEAEAYIRRIMGETTTEEIESKRKKRYANKSPYAPGYVPDELDAYVYDLNKLKNLINELKAEQSKTSSLRTKVSPAKYETEFVGQNQGDYDSEGDYKGKNAYYYKLKGKTPARVKFNIPGAEDLEYAIAKALSSENFDDMQENLQEALDAVKKLPRSNPKVAEIKTNIKNLLEARRTAPKKKVPLPDKKFKDSKKTKKSLGLKDSLNAKELAEYIKLCRKLGLETAGQIQKFAKDHGDVKNQALLEALRKEANKK